MPSETYRYYRIDGGGHLHDAEWFDAASEDDAVAYVRTKHPDARSEIWLGTRLVAKLSPPHFDADELALQDAVAQRLTRLADRVRRRREHGL